MLSLVYCPQNEVVITGVKGTTQWRQTTRTHTRNKNSQTPKKLKKNTRKPLPCKYYLTTTLDT